MALSPQPIPIPPGLNLCSSGPAVTTFVQIVNYNLQTILQAIKQQTGKTFTLPGVPDIILPGGPSIDVPGFPGNQYPISGARPALAGAFVGGRYPTGSDAIGIDAFGGLPGSNGITVPGSGGIKVPGVGPIELVLNLIEENFELLTKAFPNIKYVPIVTPPFYNPCANPNLTPSLINMINIAFFSPFGPGGGLSPGGNPCDVFGGLNGAAWTQDDGGDSNTTFAFNGDGTQMTVTRTAHTGTVDSSDSRAIDGPSLGACGSNLHVAGVATATISSFSGGIPEVYVAIQTTFDNTGPATGILADQLGVTGTQTMPFDFTFPLAHLTGVSFLSHMIGAQLAGNTSVSITDFSIVP